MTLIAFPRASASQPCSRNIVLTASNSKVSPGIVWIGFAFVICENRHATGVEHLHQHRRTRPRQTTHDHQVVAQREERPVKNKWGKTRPPSLPARAGARRFRSSMLTHLAIPADMVGGLFRIIKLKS